MNILFLSTENPFPVDHGHHIRTFHNLSALSRAHHIHFVCFDTDGSGEAHRSPLEKYCQTVDIFPLPFQRRRQLRLAATNLFSPQPLFVEKYAHRGLAARIAELIRSKKIDLVHFDLLHLAHLRKYTTGLPAILVNHNVESLRMFRWAKIEKNPLLKVFLRYQAKKLLRYESEILRTFDHCICVSADDRRVLSEMSGLDRLSVLPNGVDADFFSPAGEADIRPGSLIWTGSMNSPYNRDAVDYFLREVWPPLNAAYPDVRATFVGKSPTAALQTLANADSRIDASGFVADVRPFVDRAAVFIAPLRSGSGTKIKVLNAMAQAKPVVTTTVGAEGIDVRNGEDIIIADDPADFAQAIVQLLNQPQRARQIGKNARRVIVERYDRKAIEQQTLQLYKTVFENYHRGQTAVRQTDGKNQ